MIKRVSLVRRLDHLTPAEFAEHWMGAHADIVRRLPGLRGLRFGIVREWSPPDQAWDGIGELWFDSVEAAVEAFAAEPMASELAADRKLLFAEAQSCFVDEHTAVPPPL